MAVDTGPVRDQHADHGGVALPVYLGSFYFKALSLRFIVLYFSVRGLEELRDVYLGSFPLWDFRWLCKSC